MECKYRLTTNGKAFFHELIDTLWNVNIFEVCTPHRVSRGINRYIMECKYTLKKGKDVVDRRINRYIMECKSGSLYAFCFQTLELIDTLWNVNKHWFKGFLDSDAEN